MCRLKCMQYFWPQSFYLFVQFFYYFSFTNLYLNFIWDNGICPFFAVLSELLSVSFSFCVSCLFYVQFLTYLNDVYILICITTDWCMHVLNWNKLLQNKNKTFAVMYRISWNMFSLQGRHGRFLAGKDAIVVEHYREI